jgi:predicted acetyltransferase
MTIVYRPVGPDERAAFYQNAAMAFGGTAQRWEENGALSPGASLRGLYVDGQLVAQLELRPSNVNTGTYAVPCWGLGGVATRPDQRRRGYAAQLLHETCAELQSQQIPLTMLVPAKYSFYQRYGWAVFHERRRYTAPPSAFASFQQAVGQFTPAGPDEIPELDQIYRNALRGRFGPLERSPEWWQIEVLGHGWSQKHVQIWRDDQGRGRAYLIYRIDGRHADQRIRCREMVALDPVARGQLFRYLASHSEQCREVQFYAPPDAPVSLLFPDPLECLIEPGLMLRIVDLLPLLSGLVAAPDLAGRVVLGITDAWQSGNAGIYALECAKGVCQVERLPNATPADLTCDIRVFTQIFTRYLRARTAAAFGLLAVQQRSALALFDALFTGLAPFCSDDF